MPTNGTIGSFPSGCAGAPGRAYLLVEEVVKLRVAGVDAGLAVVFLGIVERNLYAVEGVLVDLTVEATMREETRRRENMLVKGCIKKAARIRMTLSDAMWTRRGCRARGQVRDGVQREESGKGA